MNTKHKRILSSSELKHTNNTGTCHGETSLNSSFFIQECVHREQSTLHRLRESQCRTLTNHFKRKFYCRPVLLTKQSSLSLIFESVPCSRIRGHKILNLDLEKLTIKKQVIGSLRKIWLETSPACRPVFHGCMAHE